MSSKENEISPNNTHTSEEEDELEDYPPEEDVDLEIKELKYLIKNPNKLYKKINEFIRIANSKIKANKHKEALLFLQQSEKILEFAASCGKQLDRNLIIVVLYDSACAYQGLWQLDKCSKYLDGVIYNLESCLKEDEQTVTTFKSSSPHLTDYKANRIKKLKFLILTNLQYSAILSQLAQHEKSLENAKKTWKSLADMFKECFDYVKDLRKKNEHQFLATSSKSLIVQNPKKTVNRNIFTLNESSENTYSTNHNNLNNLTQKKLIQSPVSSKKFLGMQLASPQNSTQLPLSQNHVKNTLNEEESSESNSKTEENLPFWKKNNTGFIKNEIAFSEIVIDYALPILEYITSLKGHEEISSQGKEILPEVRKSLYFWKNNPENNEIHIRKELKLPTEKDDEEKRSLLGVADSTEWLQNFNIGAIMHMNPITYEEFMFYGEIIYEISKKLLLEKVIYFSIILFTMATEIRFIEMEKSKPEKKKTGEGEKSDIIRKNAKEVVEDCSGEVKISEIFHLKAIEIVCKCISCNCPYINHLITSFHKHYNQSLEIIPEESFISCTVDPKRSSPINRETSAEIYNNKTSKILFSKEDPDKNQIIEDINNINIESSLACFMTNSPRIKQLILGLKKKNYLKLSKKKDTSPELDAAQQLLLRALNENLKKSLQEKKIINIRNSYKFVLGTPPQNNKLKEVNKNKTENLKKSSKLQLTPSKPPLKNKLKDIESFLKSKFKFQGKIDINSKNLNSIENFKPLSARTYNEMEQKAVVKNTINSKTPRKMNAGRIFAERIWKENEEQKKFIKAVPKLNLDSLKKSNLQEGKFLTPKENKMKK